LSFSVCNHLLLAGIEAGAVEHALEAGSVLEGQDGDSSASATPSSLASTATWPRWGLTGRRRRGSRWRLLLCHDRYPIERQAQGGDRQRDCCAFHHPSPNLTVT
jgi:hypothetical protein